MTTANSTEPLSHQEAWDLLPWYVNGTLATEEASAVEAQLERHADLRQELAAQQRLARGVADLDMLDVEMEGALGNLSQRLEATEQQPAALDRGGSGGGGGLSDLWRRLWSQLLAFDARVVLPVGAAAAALVLVFVLQPIGQEEAEFKTLTNPQAVQFEGQSLTVKAVAGADEEALRRLFRDQGLTLISGPSAKGVYSLAVPEGEDAAGVAAVLAESSLIDFSSVR